LSLLVDEHREYLADATRVALFRRALAETIRPGAVVVDVGCGTGILGLLACAAGARRVYAIEATGMAEIARALAAANGFDDRMHVLHGHSSEVALPERADVLVADFVGRFGFDAGIFEIYPQAVQRFLQPRGIVVPSAVTLVAAPVERADLHAQVQFWRRPDFGFRLEPAFEWAVNTGYPVTLESRDLLSDPAVLATLVTTEAPAAVRADVEVSVARDGTLHGIGGWFEAALSPGVTMTNSPLSPERIRRRNVFLPIEPAVHVAGGDRIRIRVHVFPNDLVVTWRVEVTDRNGDVRARASHSTLKGMLISREDLRRGDPDFVPALTPRGVARLTTLHLCDGHRSLSDIEQLVQERHPDLFATRGEAAAFVAEVVSGYAEL
jgi:protein arginine N-methyltransferase 1